MISDASVDGETKHIVELLMCSWFSDRNIGGKKMNEVFTICKSFLKYKNAKTGETLLMKLVKTNSNKIAFNYLLGASYDEDMKDWLMALRASPRVDLNV